MCKLVTEYELVECDAAVIEYWNRALFLGVLDSDVGVSDVARRAFYDICRIHECHTLIISSK